MSEKLCLQWNDFKDNVNKAFASLREDCDFADVTLACEDGQQIEAHKVILAASSPCFKKLLKRNRHPHPLIYMRGIKSEDLVAIVDFLYCGEANVFQENLDCFLAIAEELELKGLMSGPKNDQEKERNVHAPHVSSFTDDNPADIKEPRIMLPLKKQNKADEANKVVALQGNITEDLEDLSQKVKSLMTKSEHDPVVGGRQLYICKICGKDGKILRSRNALAHHTYKTHK